jgi:hypothetical protein
MKLFISTVVSVAVSIGIIVFTSEDEQSKKMVTTTNSADLTKVPAEHQRPADQTFLTYPEWFLVFSPGEFAIFSRSETPDRFPFFGHIGQFWHGYRKVYGVIRNRYPFNFGYHVMILVIGTSTTVEYGLRACYEKVIGRLSRFTSTGSLTDEDRFAAQVAQEYVDFIKVRPWYEFDFKSRLAGLWSLPATGENIIRKCERRYILTTDFSVKTLYGWLIGKMTKVSYDEALTVTGVVVDNNPDLTSLPLARHLQTFDDGSTLLLLPRYDAFKDYALTFSRNNINFIDIAGNTDIILVTYIVPAKFVKDESVTSILFCEEIQTDPAKKRMALVVPIKDLSHVMVHYDKTGITLEHVYDF